MSIEDDKNKEAKAKETQPPKQEENKAARLEQDKVDSSCPSDSHDAGDSGKEAPDWKPALTEQNKTLEERREAARKALPERFDDAINQSEVTKVMSAEEYNDPYGKSDSSEGKKMEQLPAKETSELNVVEMKLGCDLPVHQVHSNNETTKDNHYGKWFAEHGPSQETSAEAKESFMIFPSDEASHVKTHVSSGVIKAGSTVLVSEVGPRTIDLKAA